MNPPPGLAPEGKGARPFDELTPHRILDMLEAVGLPSSGGMLQLNSYENRVVQSRLEDGRMVVAKFYRSGRWTDEQILEEHGFAAELAADEVPVAAPLTLGRGPGAESVQLRGEPPTLAVDAQVRMAVALRCGGRSPDLDAPGVLERVGHFLGRLHRCGRRGRFEHRLRNHDAAPGQRALDWLLSHDVLPPTVREHWADAAQAALTQAQACFAAVPGLECFRIHGDFHPGNLLWTDAGPHFVDLDDACTGPAIQDFWMLLSGSRQAMRNQLLDLLDGYELFCEFDWREWDLLEALRTVRMLHHSAWLAQRWADPAFPAAFPWFGDEAYWRSESALLREQVERMRGDVTE